MIIESIGVEIEGGIRERELEKLAELSGDYEIEDFEWGEDGSVNVHPPDDNFRGWMWNAELRFWAFTENLEAFKGFAEEVYERVVTDESCGTHFHFTSDYWQILSFRKFYKRFIREYKKMAEKKKEEGEYKYMERLSSRWCSPKYIAEKQLSLDTGDRYTAINFCSLFRHNTLEIRIMPYASSYEEFEEQLNFILDTLKKIIARALLKERCIEHIDIAPPVIEPLREEIEVELEEPKEWVRYVF